MYFLNLLYKCMDCVFYYTLIYKVNWVHNMTHFIHNKYDRYVKYYSVPHKIEAEALCYIGRSCLKNTNSCLAPNLKKGAYTATNVT